MKDIAGQEIKVGSLVGYPIRKGSKVQTELGVVAEITCIYPNQPERKGCIVNARGGKQSYKDTRELLVYGQALGEPLGPHHSAKLRLSPEATEQ